VQNYPGPWGRGEKNRRKNGGKKLGAGGCVGCNGGALASSGMEYLFHTQGIEYKYTIYIYSFLFFEFYVSKDVKGQGAQEFPKSSIHKRRRVEATEGCNINPSKYAKRTQVHKIREANFVDLLYKLRNF
jgi:hypothetical protein